jgi:hypothetical protein
MAPAKQHILSQENRSDMLAHIAQVLGGCESQQLCLSHHHHAKRGIDPSHRGQRRQRHKGVCEGGLRHNEADVLEVELLNTPGTLAKFDSSSRTKTSTLQLWKRLPAFDSGFVGCDIGGALFL